ncbi:clostripain-related cysteine peptidase [Mucilaginibacter aquatilis]|uniref:Clostripain n=1 Tax=Mucilaginibacter aquatilis TaxID=1517760 RepID=A0A6I4IQK2_9SPHI|nr:clostripain-related cysteine peptidase [Mucilaginibacter aquatilis]MVN91294.1 clostripain [Mucilaginibacter aquatilis]
MEANNNLKYDALNSINMMERGAANLDGNLLVYIKTESATSYLLKIKFDNDGNRIVSDTVKVFTGDKPSDPGRLKTVIEYTQSQYPAQSYGLVLWSHATSWAPANNKVSVRSFGSDNGIEMDIKALKDALPNNFEYIIFDACSMGSVEVLYEFKDKANYLMASPTETLAESYPYQTITPLLFNSADQLSTLAKAYYDYYNSYTDERRSASVVLVKSSELEALAVQTNKLFKNYKKSGDRLISSGVQRLDYTAGFPVPNYDFTDFLDHNFSTNQLDEIKEQLNKAVLYKAATPKFLGTNIQKFSGLSCYIPFPGDVNFSYYQQLSWYKASGMPVLFGN